MGLLLAPYVQNKSIQFITRSISSRVFSVSLMSYRADCELKNQRKEYMTKKIPHCKSCDRDGHYSIGCPYAFRKPIKVNKPLKRSTKSIKKKGKRTLEYERWRDEVAKPYLDREYGRQCNACKGMRCGNQQLDVDHILNRGSHPALRMNLDNVQYLGRYPCHVEKTNGIKQIKEDYLDESYRVEGGGLVL